MGDHLAVFGLLADVGSSLASFVDVFIWVYILLLFAYILTSWIRLPYRPWLNRVQRFLYDVCDPYLRIFRRFLPPLGPLDLSPMVAIFVLSSSRACSSRCSSACREEAPMALTPVEIRHVQLRPRLPRLQARARRPAARRRRHELRGRLARPRRPRRPGRAARGRPRPPQGARGPAADDARLGRERGAAAARAGAQGGGDVVAEAHAEARAIARRASAEKERLETELRRIRSLLRSALDSLDEASARTPASPSARRRARSGRLIS